MRFLWWIRIDHRIFDHLDIVGSCCDTRFLLLYALGSLFDASLVDRTVVGDGGTGKTTFVKV